MMEITMGKSSLSMFGIRSVIIPMMEITLGKSSLNISTMGFIMVLGVLLFPLWKSHWEKVVRISTMGLVLGVLLFS